MNYCGFRKGWRFFFEFYELCGSDRVEEVRRSGADGQRKARGSGVG